MRSAAWQGDWPITQPWGVTSLLAEPYWQAAQAHWHCGVDIGMPSGTPLFAIREGHVSAIGTGYLGILTDSGETDWYLHGYYTVKWGQFVYAGVQLGTSGAVAPPGGTVLGAHLHFEIQDVAGHLNVPESSLDPIPILEGRFGLKSITAQGALVMAALTDLEQQELLTKVRFIWNDTIQGTQDNPKGEAAALARIEADLANLAAHPAVTSDPTVAAIVTRIEAALKQA